MKFENLTIVKKWRLYAGPKDERLEAETCRIYRAGFMLLAFGMLAFFLYDMMAQQVAWVHDASSADAHAMFSSPTLVAMFAWFLIAMLACVVMQTRKGFVDTNRFAQTDRFPKGYFSLISGISGIACALVVFAMRSIAEAQIVPLDEVFWLPNLAVGAVTGALVFAATLALFYATYREAKRKRELIERKLDDEE